MSISKIVQYPDPILKQICKTVPVNTDKDKIASMVIVNKLWTNAIENDTYFYGLAAPQIGESYRIFIMRNKLTFINPRIIKASGYVTSTEQCLSIQNFSKTIRRRACVTVQYTDTDFKLITKSFIGRDAACVQHEMDHLRGVLIND